VTEQEWMTCTDPTSMILFLQATGKVSARKLRLVAVTCCRRVWPLLTDERSRRAVELAEQSVDELISWSALDATSTAAREVKHHEYHADVAAFAASYAPTPILEFAHVVGIMQTAAEAPDTGVHLEESAQAALLREVFGPLPFRPFHVAPALLRWNDGIVRRLADAVYDERKLPEGTLDATRIAVLGDALEDAGCDNADILNHCRQPDVHVRGRWVVDLLTGRG